jgi:small subunit ribosomal protein S15
MPLPKAQKTEIIEANKLHDTDTGSPEVQVAILTQRINQLTEHMKANTHDYHSQRGLLMLVGQRLRHLNYLAKESHELYRAIIAKLGLRK